MNGWLVPRDDDLGLDPGGLWQYLGSYWRDHRLYTIFGSLTRTEVTLENRRTGVPYWAVHFDQPALRDLSSNGAESMASKWIAAALKVANKQVELMSSGQEMLFKDRPALREFMCSLEAEPGKPREPSALMIAVCDAGLRVGLGEKSLDAWCWREGKDLAACLDSIEKALQSGGVVFSRKGGGKVPHRR